MTVNMESAVAKAVMKLKVGQDIYLEGVYDESIAYFIHGKLKKIDGYFLVIEAYSTDYPAAPESNGKYRVDWTYCTGVNPITNYGPMEARMGIIKPRVKIKVQKDDNNALLKARNRMKIGEVVIYRGERFSKIKNGMVKVISNHAEYEIVEV